MPSIKEEVSEWDIEEVRLWLLYSSQLALSRSSYTDRSSNLTCARWGGWIFERLRVAAGGAAAVRYTTKRGGRRAIDPLLLRSYAHAFALARIDGLALVEDGGLSVADIKGLGIPLGDARKIHARLQKLLFEHPSGGDGSTGDSVVTAAAARPLTGAAAAKPATHTASTAASPPVGIQLTECAVRQ